MARKKAKGELTKRGGWGKLHKPLGWGPRSTKAIFWVGGQLHRPCSGEEERIISGVEKKNGEQKTGKRGKTLPLKRETLGSRSDDRRQFGITKKTGKGWGRGRRGGAMDKVGYLHVRYANGYQGGGSKWGKRGTPRSPRYNQTLQDGGVTGGVGVTQRGRSPQELMDSVGDCVVERLLAGLRKKVRQVREKKKSSVF